MAKVITVKNLQAVVDRINKATKSPAEPSNASGANVGNYHLAGAYSGYALHQVVDASGGIRDISNSGYISKRALYDLMFAYLAGYAAGYEAGKP
jgi:hypothetical protein